VTDRRELLKNVIGGTEETTPGVQRLRAMQARGELAFPVISVNDALTKHMFETAMAPAQSTLDGMVRATNRLLAGSVFVVLGYGWCGRACQRAKGHGRDVVVTRIDPLKALGSDDGRLRVMPSSMRRRRRLLLHRDGNSRCWPSRTSSG